MLSTRITEFRKNTKKYLDNVINDAETLIVDRGNDKAVVILSLDEYNSMNATLHELSSRVNEKRLDSSTGQIDKREIFYKDLVDE